MLGTGCGVICVCFCQCVKKGLSLCPCCSDRHIMRSSGDNNTDSHLISAAHTDRHTSGMTDFHSLCHLHLILKNTSGEIFGFKKPNIYILYILIFSTFYLSVSLYRASVAPHPFTLSADSWVPFPPTCFRLLCLITSIFSLWLGSSLIVVECY